MRNRILSVLLLSLAVTAFGQNEKTLVGDRADVSVVRAGIHTDNIVTVIARHADGSEFYRHESHNLKTTGGIDAIASMVSNTGTQAAAANYIALSSTLSSPSASDCAAGSSSCTLVSEITTSGLARAKATYAHTAGASTYTLTYTWTASASVSAVTGAGVFNASSSGTLVFENTFTSVSLNSGDTIQVTWTITIS